MISTKIICASEVAVLDSNLSTGGGTDAAPALNAVLAEAPGLGSLELVIDGPALIGTPLKVYSNTTVRFLPGAGLFCRTGLNGPAIRNAHWVSSYHPDAPVYDGSTIVDHDITVCGPGRIVGNREEGTRGNCDGGDPRFSAANDGGTPVGCYISPVMFFGVRNLALRDFTVHDPPAFGIWIANGFRVRLADLACIDPVPGPTGERNTDGIHFNGPLDDVEIRGITLRTNDDGLAFNAGDAHLHADYGGARVFGGYESVYGGPITRVNVQGVRCHNCMSVTRLLHGPYLIDQVTMSGLSGTVYLHAIVANPFGSVPGGGSQSRVSIECDVDQTANLDGLALIGGVTRSFSLKARRVSGPGTILCPVVITGQADHVSLELETLDLGAASTEPLVHVAGASVRQLDVTGSWRRPGLPPGEQALVAITGGEVQRLNLRADVENVGGLLSHTGGELEALTVWASSATAISGAAIETAGEIRSFASVGVTTRGKLANAPA